MSSRRRSLLGGAKRRPGDKGEAAEEAESAEGGAPEAPPEAAPAAAEALTASEAAPVVENEVQAAPESSGGPETVAPAESPEEAAWTSEGGHVEEPPAEFVPSPVRADEADGLSGSSDQGDSMGETQDRPWTDEVPLTPPAAPVDSPVAEDELEKDSALLSSFFGNEFDDFDREPPPTEEVPSPVLEDLAQMYDAPMNVPEPPPIPGLFDRMTPPPASPRPESRPAAAAPAPAPAPKPKPKPVETSNAPDKYAAAFADEPKGPSIAVVLLLAVGGIGALGAVLVAFAFMAGIIGGGATLIEAGQAPVQVDNGGQKPPKPEPVPAPAPVEPAPAEPAPAPQPQPGPAPQPQPQPGAAPAPQPQPQPGAAPAPKPQPAPQPGPKPTPKPTPPTPAPGPKPVVPAPAPTPKPAYADQSIKIKSNRRVLVYVNGKAVGYSPQEYKAAAGSYVVAAMLPGDPSSKQEQMVVVEANGSSTSVSFSF